MNGPIPNSAIPALEPIRLLFELTRDDNPRLYDDLIRFNKGTKRVNRLRFLAHEGLMAQTPLLGPRGLPAPIVIPPVLSDAGQRPALAVSRADAEQMSQVFSHPLGSEDD